jgi:hypothetical protein
MEGSFMDHPYRSPYERPKSKDVPLWKSLLVYVAMTVPGFMAGLGVGRACVTVTRTVVKIARDEAACVRMCHNRVVEFRREPDGVGYVGYTCKCR